MSNISELENRIGYSFKNRDLANTALTHSSYASEHGLSYELNNERLEFIGDGYLDAIIGNKLFEIMSTSHEGTLSRDRADVVREDSLADIARSIDLGKYIRLGKGEEAHDGRDKNSILADAFEALIGAVISDGGFDKGEEMVLRLFKDKINLAVDGKLNKDYKSKLQEKLQEKHRSIKINYSLVSESGPDHDKTFNVHVVFDGKVLGKGSGKSKAKAEQAAACDALSRGDI